MLAASAEIYDLPGQEAFAAQAPLRRLREPGAVIPVDACLSA